MDEPITNFEQLHNKYKDVFLIEDEGVVKLMFAAIMANQFVENPVWVLLVAGPGGGKTALLSTLDKITHKNGDQLIWPISDLTVNTFASAAQSSSGESSLLFRMKPNSVMKFKDFTSILSKNKDARDEIMAQLREIYDGNYAKLSGNNKDINWEGRFGVLGGVTDIIYEYSRQMSKMGDRFILYQMKQPDRRAMTRRMLDNSTQFDTKLDQLQMAAKEYIDFVMEHAQPDEMQLKEETQEQLIDIADFSTRVRSPIIYDDKNGVVQYVPETELPTRMVGQMFAIAYGCMTLRQAEHKHKTDAPFDMTHLQQDEMDIIYKIAFDSIPIKRRMALRELARYKHGVQTAGLATKLNYETTVVRGWMAILNGLGVCKREKQPGPGGDVWVLDETYRDIVLDYENITPKDDSLINEEPDEDSPLYDSSLEEDARIQHFTEKEKKQMSREEEDAQRIFEQF